MAMAVMVRAEAEAVELAVEAQEEVVTAGAVREVGLKEVAAREAVEQEVDMLAVAAAEEAVVVEAARAVAA